MIAIIAIASAVAATSVWAATGNVSDIIQRGQRFDHGTLSLNRGDVVHFLNHDDVIHNINVIDSEGNPDDKGLQKPGEIITEEFGSAGTYTVRCAIHPTMKMRITVQ